MRRTLLCSIPFLAIAGCGDDNSPGPSEPDFPSTRILDVEVTCVRCQEPEFQPGGWVVTAHYTRVGGLTEPGESWREEIFTGTIPGSGVFRVSGTVDCNYLVGMDVEAGGRYEGAPPDSPDCFDHASISFYSGCDWPLGAVTIPIGRTDGECSPQD
jgi:hypothetical protein